jgi:hypothetical protein
MMMMMMMVVVVEVYLSPNKSINSWPILGPLLGSIRSIYGELKLKQNQLEKSKLPPMCMAHIIGNCDRCGPRAIQPPEDTDLTVRG